MVLFIIGFIVGIAASIAIREIYDHIDKKNFYTDIEGLKISKAGNIISSIPPEPKPRYPNGKNGQKCHINIIL